MRHILRELFDRNNIFYDFYRSILKMVANNTNKNHFVPKFYTKQWTSEDGRLCQFSRPFSVVVPKRVNPDATGYSKNLYTESDLSPELRTYLEDVFLKKVDQKANDAIQILLHQHPDDLSDTQKIAWVRFLMSMLQRSPNKIASLRKRWEEQFLTIGPELETQYQKVKRAEDPPSVVEYLRITPPEVMAKGRVQLLQSVMDLPKVGHHILNMRWGIFRINIDKWTFLTSDRPIIMTNGIERDDALIGLPIAPKTIFFAANNVERLHAIEGIKTTQFVEQINQLVISQAELYAYGTNDKALRFVEKHFHR